MAASEKDINTIYEDSDMIHVLKFEDKDGEGGGEEGFGDGAGG